VKPAAVRLFVAVNPDEHFVHQLATQLDAWRLQLRIGWSRPRVWHLTLAFLGDWPREKLPALEDSLREALAGAGPFAVTPGEIGGFPDLSRPRVLFLHMASGGRLEELAAAVRTGVDGVWPEGPQDRKPFRPHLTFARIKRPLPSSQRELLRQIHFAPWSPFSVEQVRLVRSELRPEGARHADVAVFGLGE